MLSSDKYFNDNNFRNCFYFFLRLQQNTTPAYFTQTVTTFIK